eukprot:g2397.t1
MYVYGVWGLQLKEAVNLSQLQTNILAGVIFSGGSFLTTLILKHASRTLRGAALLPAATGALAYALLAGLPEQRLSFGVLLLLIAMIGYSVMGLFIAAIQAISHMSFVTGFNVNVGTAIAQTSYGLGCVVWVFVFDAGAASDWRRFCFIVALPTLCAGLLALLAFPGAPELHRVRAERQQQEEAEAEEQQQQKQKQQLQVGEQQQKDAEHGKDAFTPGGSTGRARTVLVLMLLLYLIWYGSSIVLLTNSGTLMQSMGQKAKATELTALFGLGQTCGRLTSLGFAVRARRAHGEGTRYRLWLLWQPVVGTALLIAVHAIAVIHDSVTSLTVVLALSGVPYGLSWTSLFHTMDALFDSTDIVTALGMAFGPGLGPLVFNTVVGQIYDTQNTLYDVQNPDSAAGSCQGTMCYGPSFRLLFVADIVALAMALAIRGLAASARALPLQPQLVSDAAAGAIPVDASPKTRAAIKIKRAATDFSYLTLKREPSFVILKQSSSSANLSNLSLSDSTSNVIASSKNSSINHSF